MISKKMLDALNKQFNEEMASFYIYLAMAGHFETVNLKGFASWMMTQVQEEMSHSMKFYNYTLERGGEVQFPPIKEAKSKWNSPLELFEDALNHERFITKCINERMDIAIEEKDHAARNFLNWFVDEQVEEEDTFTEVVDKLKMIGDHNPMLLMLDKELGQRRAAVTPFDPAPAAN